MALPDDVRTACAAVAAQARHVRIEEGAVAAYARTLPADLAARARPRPRRARRAARGLRAPAQRGQLRLGLVPDAAQAARALGLPHGRGRAQGARALDAPRRLTRSTPPRRPRRSAARTPSTSSWRCSPARCGSWASTCAPSTAARSSRSPAPATARRSRWPSGSARCRPGATSPPTTARAVPFFKRAQLAAADLHLQGLAPAATPPADAVRRQPRAARAADRRRARLRPRRSSRASTARSCSSTTRPRRSRSAPAPSTRSSCSSRRTRRHDATAIDNALWHRGAAPRYKAHPRHRARTTAY